MDIREQYARAIATWRGADPDAPITMEKPQAVVQIAPSEELSDEELQARLEAAQENPVAMSVRFERAWQGYLDIADTLLALSAVAVEP
ncbi:hypothetical protein [Rhizorhabdus histidinilytica]|uniref:hypothetical protein n=1 Tax=Rhizorhabdus histidinilytica TaxID=439228 RepID=UPI0032203A39